MIKIGYLFKPEMAKAAHENRKWQTRRLLNCRNVLVDGMRLSSRDFKCLNWNWELWPYVLRDKYKAHVHAKVTGPVDVRSRLFGKSYVTVERFAYPGNEMWARETWQLASCADSFAPKELDPAFWKRNGLPWYCADGDWQEHPAFTKAGRKRSAMLMPYWASRTRRTITRVWFERLQDISEQDAKAEGLYQWEGDSSTMYYGIQRSDVWETDPRKTFQRLWDSINAKKAPWESNPIVIVTEWERP